MKMSKHSSCLIHRNFLVGISYSDATPGQSFSYNHLGQLTQITDASGTRTFAYNPYGEPETDCLEANGISWQVSELYDGLGRQAGYELSADGRRVQQARLSYDGKGRLSALAAEGMETPFSWTYCEQGGLVEQLAYPNGMTRVNTYENSRDLLSVIDYRRPGSANPPARHEYDYDALGRPTRRRDTWNTAAPKTTRLFTYNSRGELVGDQLRPGGRFGYQYDNIGNRKEAFEFGNTTDYETDELNRYAGIVRNGGEAFTPQYDADGNQTLVKTSTGIWTVTYNAENRPVKFESEDGGTTVECAYDSMGRRFEKKVTVGGTTGFHARYLYRDYLQVAECDLTGETPVLVRSYLWDPSEPEATRVLAMTRWEANGTQVKEHLYCMHDAMKNVTSLFGEARGRRALYEYRPYGGLVTSEGNMAEENKFRFSSEYMDDELGLIYYNYRHLNPHDGRWISRDPIMEQGGWNLYAFAGNNSMVFNDRKGENYNPFTPGIMNPPSTYNSPVYTPSLKDTSDTDISITYSAMCQNMGIWDWIVNKLLADKITKTPSDFDPNSECGSCQCIKKLTVIMHGKRETPSPEVSAHWGNTYLYETDKIRGISNMFKNIKFCSSCELELRSCYLGEQPLLKQRLEDNTKCKVTVYQGKINAFFPF